MDNQSLDSLVRRVSEELSSRGLIHRDTSSNSKGSPSPILMNPPFNWTGVDLSDPAIFTERNHPGILSPADPEGLSALMSVTPARIGVGKAGARYRTRAWLLFQADFAVTQDALFREVDVEMLEQHHLFTVQSAVSGGRQEYLVRPDLGRRLSPEAMQQIAGMCQKSPNLQICVGDGLSAAAIEANISRILPVIIQGAASINLTVGTTFYIRNCRVGIMNDIGDLLKPDVLILLIGERPGLGRADSMSAYMAYRPKAGDTDAERDVICNIHDGGTNPLEAGAYTLQLARKMLEKQASGIRLRQLEGAADGNS